ncbi:hypothetical protein KP509_1Z213100 [Ceratopteris richardii]|nr:hypothetical protein KP509_1Z213100 [Ceratopteris richardii]
MGRELLQQQERWSATAIVAFTVLIGTFSEGEPMILSKDVWLGGSSYCGVSLKQGRRPHQEDRVICMPELLLPGPGVCFVKVGLFGVFDGHNGAEASEFASKYLPHLLHHHTRSIVMHGSNDFHGEVCLESDFAKWNLKDLYFPPLNGQFEQYTSIVNEGGMLVHCEDQQYHVSSYRAVLKEALARSLADIDSALLHSFSELGHQSGSTAVIVLNVNSSILVANIGDSQALICSPYIFTGSPARNISFPFQDDVQIMSTKELTVAHHPDRVDEKSRIEAAGGFVSTLGGVARVNGQLAISRALGDATFKKYGVIAEPEFFGWQQITADNSFLIVASDGIFEQMNPQDVCNLLQDHYEQLPGTNHHFAGVMIDYNALADTIVQAAYASGSFDNLAAVLYPLTSQSTGKHRTIKTLNSPATNEGISNKLSSSEQSSFCYELIDKVPNGVILSQRSSLNFLSSVSTDKTVNSNSLIKGLTDFNNAYKQIKGLAASVDIYREHLVCLAGPAFSDDDEVCLNSETFSNYLGLIEAVPMLESSSEVSNCEQFRSTNSNNLGAYKSIHMRYILTKNIGRGGFGEVWFAVMRNCTDAETMDKTHYEIIHDAHMKSYQLKNEMLHRLLLSIPKATKTDPPYDYVVLKRIMAEKGNAVYLSGLRERHFGQIFSNEMALKNSRSCPKMKLAEETEDGLKHIARYVESIEGSKSGDFWLVFVNEGYPLSSMLYSTDATFEEEKGHVRVLKPSKWWRWLRTTKAGKREMRSLMYQLILAVKACHDRNITHRDIKPGR